MSDDTPKAQIVTLVGDIPEDQGQVMKIVRPVDPKAPSFEIYTESEGMILAYPFDSEVGEVLKTLVGEEGTTYHKAVDSAQGIVFASEEVEGLSW